MNNKAASRFIIAAGVIVLISLACTLTAPKPTSEPPSVSSPEPATVVPPSPEPPASITVTAEPIIPEATATTAIAGESCPVSAFSWISMCIPAGLADGGQSVVVAEVVPSDQSPAWDVAPQHEEIKFTGFAINETFLEPQINVYPVQDFIALQPVISESAATLQKIIQDKSDEPGNVPILPLWNATQVFLAKPAYLDFKDGSGIRYITQYGQAIMPINNHDLFYSFQGLSSDGKYWISAVVPVNHPSIQATYDNPLPADMDQFMANYAQYTALIRANLDTQPLETFTPSLADLDAMIQSIVITQN